MESAILAMGLTSFALGGVMTLLAWNAIRQNRRRDAARTALLSQLAFPGGPPEAVTAAPASAFDLFRADEAPRESPLGTEPLFTKPESLGADSRRTLALGALSMAIAFAIGALVGFATLPQAW